jgi:acyl carrier protein
MLAPEHGLPDVESIRSIVRRIAHELAPNQTIRDFTPELRLVDDLHYHSLALMELAFTLEDEFGLEPINEEQVSKIVTVGHVEDHVVNEVLRKSAAT